MTDKLHDAVAALKKLQLVLAVQYGADLTKPYQINLEQSTAMSYVPLTVPWTKLGIDGDTVTIKAGSVVRYGVTAGTQASYPPGTTTTAATDMFTTVTVTADTTVVINPAGMASIGIATDPAFGYVKELDVSGGAQ